MYCTTLLNGSFDKKTFCCGKSSLDHYLHTQASQDMKRKISAVFVLPDEKNNRIKGYYTLSNDGISRQVLPDVILKKMPKSYENLPITLLGRLAVDERYVGKGLGKLLLVDALMRSYTVSSSAIGSMAVIVDPLDEEAEKFYLKYGFIKLPTGGRMFLPMHVIEKLI